jgi:hypothetical protein
MFNLDLNYREKRREKKKMLLKTPEIMISGVKAFFQSQLDR